MNDSGQASQWEDLRREARRLESDLEAKLSSFAKLCNMLTSTGTHLLAL